MKVDTNKITWQETLNNITIDCSLNIALHSAPKSKVIVLIIPGVDGSIDGYENKYLNIANELREKRGVNVLRMNNPFITSYHWQSNIRKVLEYVSSDIGTDLEIRVVAHSVGATVLSSILEDYPNISKVLLINPAVRSGAEEMFVKLKYINSDNINVLIAGDDSSAIYLDEFKSVSNNVVVIDNADHNFSGDVFHIFLEAPNRYLFQEEKV